MHDRIAPVRILHFEPNQPDSHWLRIVLDEMEVAYEMHQYNSVGNFQADLLPAIDLVIVNHTMPLLEISDAIRRLRAVPSLAAIPIIVSISQDHEKTFAPDATGFLYKPADAGQMAALLALIPGRQSSASAG
jgi:CheY-like chemotaxis protein